MNPRYDLYQLVYYWLPGYHHAVMAEVNGRDYDTLNGWYYSIWWSTGNAYVPETDLDPVFQETKPVRR